MANRNQYSRPGNFNQIPNLRFTGGVTFNTNMSGTVSGALGGSVATSTVATAVNAGDIITLTQSAPIGTIAFSNVTLAASQSFSVVIANDQVKSSSLGASTIITTVAPGDINDSRATLSASSAGEVKIAVAGASAASSPLAADSLQINYMIIGGSN